MRWIISPAKKMRREQDFLRPQALPEFLPDAERLLAHLRGLEYGALKKLLACNDQLARQSYEQYRTMDPRHDLTPALLAYQGIQYQYMAPNVLEEGDYEELQEHLRILSGFYGLLRPLDGVTPYRLEMQAKLRTEFCRDLYDFWGDRLAKRLAAETDLILNLASEEYARAVRHRLPAGTRLVDVIFGEITGGGWVEKGVYVKMARGEMVRFLARNRARTLADVTAFDHLNYRHVPEASSPDRLVFLRAAAPGKSPLDTPDKSC
nr:peroxide stress protein YaaA [uncultured Oscillibacter sp.]